MALTRTRDIPPRLIRLILAHRIHTKLLNPHDIRPIAQLEVVWHESFPLFRRVHQRVCTNNHCHQREKKHYRMRRTVASNILPEDLASSEGGKTTPSRLTRMDESERVRSNMSPERRKCQWNAVLDDNVRRRAENGVDHPMEHGGCWASE